ncbi:vezatin-like isoform X2 [Halichondria panicea]|uniref:vezatin-like isoform X2 n=1 Tax=Halichondria panicea TaxID=6063 RepID=UPI00312BC41B
MDEEGTIVYFKTSPSVQDAEEELIFGEVAHVHVNNPTPSYPSVATKPQSSLFGRLSGYAEQLLTYAHSRDKSQQLLSELVESSLLTEEDCHILHVSLKHPLVPCTTSQHSTRWSFYWLPALVALGASLLYVGSHILIVGTIILIAILGSAEAIINRYNQKRLVYRWRKYSNNCEELLTLLTKSLRLIQETEVLSRGYSRPLATVPVSRLEQGGGSHSLQCVPLRKRVFHVCSDGVQLLRTVTKRLCTSVAIAEELDNTDQYLAFRELKTLHQHMEGSKEGEDDFTNEQLSLESLKDACNLFAVQNSEFLRRLALLIGLSNTSSKVVLFESTLKEVLPFMSKAPGELDWGLQYQRDFLFGEPPGKTEDVHCLDLKLQLALHSVRNIGALLTERYSSSGSRPSEKELLGLREQFSNMESQLSMTAQHCSGGEATLTKMLAPSTDESASPPETHPPPNVTCQGSKEEAKLTTEDTSDEEDVVFEAYVPPDAPDALLEEVELVTDEERQRLKEVEEVPAHLLRELNSVLAVRNEAREKRRQAKRTKSSKQTLLAHSQDSKETYKDHAINTLDISREETTLTDGIDASVAIKKESKEAVDDKEVEEPYRGVNFMTGLEQSSLAVAVAAVALRQRQHTEEFFEEHD